MIHMEESGYYALANTDRMSVFLICIKNKQGELSGNIVNFYLKEPMKEAYEKRELDREHIPLKYCTKIQNMNRFMAIGTTAYETLVIEIHQRQFSSMQGRIKGKCIEGNYISFRSALELMRMLREYEYMRNGMDERTDKISGQ